MHLRITCVLFFSFGHHVDVKFNFMEKIRCPKYKGLLYILGVRANVQPKSSIPIGAKVGISPKGFTRGVEAELEKFFSICPKLLINVEL